MLRLQWGRGSSAAETPRQPAKVGRALSFNYATNVRREYGLEAAQILLGHSSAMITDAVYAERDMKKALEIAAKIG